MLESSCTPDGKLALATIQCVLPHLLTNPRTGTPVRRAEMRHLQHQVTIITTEAELMLVPVLLSPDYPGAAGTEAVRLDMSRYTDLRDDQEYAISA